MSDAAAQEVSVGRAARVVSGIVGVYQRVLSPMLPARCRFYPSCSEYARQALEIHGLVRGSWLALRRLSRCHPFHAGGFDEVPPAGMRGAA